MSSRTPPPDPLAAGTGVRWDVALGSLGDRRRLSPIAWSGGFAALDANVDRHHRMWLSADGRSWTSHGLPRPLNARGTTLLAFRGSLVLVDVSYVVRGSVYDIWMSRDGLTWAQRTTLSTLAALPNDVEFGSMMALGNRLALFSYISPQGSGGARPASIDGAYQLSPRYPRDGAAMSRGAPILSERGMYLLTSSDGRAWTRQRMKGVAHDFINVFSAEPGSVDGIREIGSRFWLVHSRNGIRWQAVAPLPQQIGEGDIFTLVATTDGYVLSADTGEAHALAGPALTVWRVSRGGTFTQVFDRVQWGGTGLEASGATVVITGNASSRAERAFALVSTDSGATFQISAGWPAMQSAAGCFGAVAIRDGTAVASSACTIDPSSTLLVAELP